MRLPCLLLLFCFWTAEIHAQRIRVPIYNPGGRFLSTQLTVVAGASRSRPQAEHATGLSIQLKQRYMVSGVLYVNAGLGYSMLRDYRFLDRTPDPDYREKRRVSTLTLPVGGGFAMGDDRGLFFTGFDVLPAYYIDRGHATGDLRKVVLGFAPEMGFLLKVGRAYSRGIYLGLIGRYETMPYPEKIYPFRLRYSVAGAGLVLIF